MDLVSSCVVKAKIFPLVDLKLQHDVFYKRKSGGHLVSIRWCCL